MVRDSLSLSLCLVDIASCIIFFFDFLFLFACATIYDLFFMIIYSFLRLHLILSSFFSFCSNTFLQNNKLFFYLSGWNVLLCFFSSSLLLLVVYVSIFGLDP